MYSNLQEENNNSVSNEQNSSDSSYANQVLQSLTNGSQGGSLDSNSDSLLALAVALRTSANAADGRFTSSNSLLTEKLLSPNINDLDNLTISNTPHRMTDKGKCILFVVFFVSNHTIRI